MRINQHTRIASLLRYNPEALEAIVSLSPGFKKLRNPILRKLMAGRTSIAMASKIGGCKPEDFFNVLQPIGFIPEDVSSEVKQAPVSDMPDFLKKITPENISTLDVRPLLKEGKDPLKVIRQSVNDLKQAQVFKLVNSFEPVPLIELLEKQGFQSYVNVIDTDLVESYFYRTGEEAADDREDVIATDDWDTVLNRFEGRLHKIDVRHLEMPLPMITILETLETLEKEKSADALYVHHKRVPVFLLSALRERNFDFRMNKISESEVYLLIFKAEG
jgi:hypothetical protein